MLRKKQGDKMLKPLLLTLLLLTLNAKEMNGDTLPIRFYNDAKLEKVDVKAEGRLEIESPNSKNRTKIITGPFWNGTYSFTQPIKKRDFITSVKKSIVSKNGKISYKQPSFVHCSFKENGKVYWAEIMFHNKKEYVVRLVEEKDMSLKKTASKMDFSKDSVVFYGLKFASGKFELLKGSEEDLDKIETPLKKFPNLVIRIEGHTDSKGSAEYNQKLSEKRANAVRDALIKRGIDPKRLKSVGLGESRLISSISDAENRRVEIVKLSGGECVVSMDNFPPMTEYKKEVVENKEKKWVRGTYTLDSSNVIAKDTVLDFYESIVSKLGGKITSKNKNKMTFDFNKKVSGKLTVFKRNYYLTLTDKKGEK